MTNSFLKALDLNSNVFIEACAGAGKTYILAKRYARIMDEFAITGQHDARNILVITFTKKAAAEMSGRIYQDLNKLLNDEPLEGLPQDFGSNLRNATPEYKTQIRATFSQNAISTIDSFCAGILRDHAQLAGLDPEFVPQDEAETDRIYLETWQTFLQHSSRERDDNLAALLGFFTRNRIENAIKAIHSSRQLLDEWLTVAAESAENLKLRLEEYFPITIDISRWSQKVLTPLSLLPGPAEMLNPDEKNYRLYANAKITLPQLDLVDPELEDIARFMDILNDLTTTNDGTWRKRIDLPKHSWPAGSATDAFRQAVKNFIDDFSSQHDAEIFTRYATLLDIQACDAQHLLAQFYLKFERELQQNLAAQKVLSFEEIITHTHRLLKEHPEIATRYGRQFKHIMVDEFQDTNEVRWNIIRLIASQNDQLRTAGLFIVGDTKQSIYRFNQADVSVMHRVQKLIETSSGHHLRLNETYRSSRAFVETVINPLMSRHFPENPEALPLYDTTFQPTSIASASGVKGHLHEISRCVIAAVAKSPATDSLQMGGSPDIIQTARRALEMVEWAEANHLTSSGEPVVGILLRAFTRIGEYIQIFNRLNIPFQVVAGKGLFRQQEAFDLLHWVRVMINPLDDLALVGLLRSPFFAVPDRDIHALAKARTEKNDGSSLWSFLENLQPTVFEYLTEWRKKLRTEPLDRILEEILAGDDRLLGWFSETAGSQRVSNLNRLIHILHQQSRQGKTIHDIFHYLDFQINHGGDAAQADLPNPAKIQIMTIHKAKGLEFPVVILPELHRKKNSDTTGIAVERWPDGKRAGEWLVGLTMDNLTDGGQKTNLQKFLSNQRQLEETAEERRLLYVAVTRAKFGLVCAAEIDPAKFPGESSWWGKFIAPHYGLPHQVDKQQVNELAPNPETWRALSSSFQNTEIILERPDTFLLPTLKSTSWNPPLHAKKVRQFAEISPHDIMDWIKPGSGSFIPETQSDLDEDGNPYALTFGRVLHKIMELSWWDTAKHLPDIQTYLESEGVFQGQEQYLNDLDLILKKYRSDPFYEVLRKLPGERKFPELPLLGWMENDAFTYRVTGILDLLYQRENGEWVVLDYKTDKESPRISEGAPHAYWFQIQTYLWMVKQSFGLDAVGELYFIRTGEWITIKPDFELYARLIAEKHGDAPLALSRLESTGLFTNVVAAIKKTAPTTPYFLLEPTRGLAIRAYQTLAANNLFRPGCVIQSQREFLKCAFPAGRRLSPDIARMAVATILKNQDLAWGVYRQLADAVMQHYKFGTPLDPPFTGLPEQVRNWCRQHEVITDHDALPVSEWKLPSDNIPIFIDGLFSTTPLDYELFGKLQTAHRNTILLQKTAVPKIADGWRWEERVSNPLMELPNASKPDVFVCFSVDDEVDRAAQQVAHLIAGGARPDNIKIAVSSMERYVPAIKRTFHDYGIPVTIAKHEPVGERPATQLALCLLDCRLSYHLSWQQVTAVWMHPLLDMVPEIQWDGRKLALGTFQERLYLDHFVRSKGWSGLNELRTFLDAQSDADPNNSVLKSAGKLLTLTDALFTRGKSADTMAATAEWLELAMTALQIERTFQIDEIGQRTVFAIKNTLRKIESTWSAYAHRPGTAGELYRELSEKLGEEEIKSAPQPFGVEILGNQETVNLAPEHLIVLGLSEGQFPVTPRKNPYLQHLPFNPWYFNLAIFMRWLALGSERVTFYAPNLSVSGESLQPSTFIEYLNLRHDAPYNHHQQNSFRHYLSSLENQLLADGPGNQITRHNQYLTSAQNDFSGNVGLSNLTEFSMSASRLDHLLKCPQRYWYSDPINLAALDEDVENTVTRRVGNFIHKVLECFGNPAFDGTDGFELLNRDFCQAVEYLANVAEKLKPDFYFDGELDLLTEGKLFPFFNALRETPEQSLLGALLKWNEPLAGKFTGRFFEQPFGLDGKENSWPVLEIASVETGIKLKLRGIIDRIFTNQSDVWAVDYKTGRVKIKDTRDFFTSQLFVYLLALRQQFSGHHIILSYEKLRSLKRGEHGISELVGELAEDHPVLVAKGSGRNDIDINEPDGLSLDQIVGQIMQFAAPLKTGSFHLTTRSEKRACEFCEFEQICRKTTVFHRAETTDQDDEFAD